jgi:hypothetical protein
MNPSTIALCLCLALTGCAGAPRQATATSFAWLAGCWQTQRDDENYEEMWLPVTADGTIGAAREVRGGRTVFHEFSRIELRRDGTAVYVAQPKGQTPVEFRMVERDQGRIAFENPGHDFPTRIEYRYVDSNAMHARISGTIDGADRATDYPMQRIACEG